MEGCALGRILDTRASDAYHQLHSVGSRAVHTLAIEMSYAQVPSSFSLSFKTLEKREQIVNDEHSFANRT